MSDTIPYPQYGAPAQFIERSWPHSSDGRMPPRKTGCLSKHWLTPQTDTVHPQRPTPRTGPGEAGQLTAPALAAVQTSSIEARDLDMKAKGDADVPGLWHR
jgi:hypothetical protein